ncbi:FAD-dependent oxidoreductase [Streptomyces sodiiphilus]|uniref:ferredoxin--NADP(+) reductase n=1 Tax=Streptomyces sodiiphilus TaxID=226217 RepID=A0ABN2P2N1_9ACTN
MLRVAVVGSGPSGVYTAQVLTEHRDSGCPVTVDVLDRLPCPYGLVRYGVAPDHERIKSLQGTLRTVLERPGVRFLGNVHVGPQGVGTDALRRIYHAVVYCVGAAADRRLGIPGEDLAGSRSATEFVSWYSAHPDAPAGFPLTARSAVVIGAGNVALDVARILARDPAELTGTDMPRERLEALAAGRIRDIHLVARRGPAQARFSTKELRELGALPHASVRTDPGDLDAGPAAARADALPAAARRNLAVLRGWAAAGPGEAARRIRLRFFLRPVALLDDGRGAVRAVRFERTTPDGTGGVSGTGVHEEVAAQLVLRSVGYRGRALPGLPFDASTGTVPHAGGRVLREGFPSPGEYVAGWIKRGPTGVIGSNRPCAKETATALLADAAALARRAVAAGGPAGALRAAGADPVGWEGWRAIQAAEAETGRLLSRGPVKIPDWTGLLAAARSGG